MKKALLALAAAFGIGFAANADVAKITYADLGYTNQEVVTSTKVNEYISLTYNKGTNSNDPKYYNTGKALRLYGGSYMTVSATEGYKITKIEFTVGSSNGWNSASTVSTGTFSDNTWTGDANEIKFTQGGSSGHVRIETITFTYESTVAPAVLTPVFSQEGNTVTITCATEGAEIYYTEGYGEEAAEPTTASTKYTGPMEIWYPNSYKAIAVKDGETSAVATYDATYTFSEAENFGTLIDMPDMLGSALDRTTFELNFTMHVCAQLGANLWLRDDQGNAMLAYGYDLGTYTNGQTISGLTANLTLYNGALPELTNVKNIGTVAEGTPVNPIEIELGSMYQSMLNWYVVVKTAELSGISGRNATLTQDGETIGLYSYNSSFEYPEAGYYNVIAAVSINKGTLQLTPIEFVACEKVETPVFVPASGNIDIDTQTVTITCATEDATIYYTMDGTDPSEENGTIYTGAFKLEGEGDITVKAIAIKDGMLDSEIASALYKRTSGVEDIILGSAEAVEYFNLQGVRVAEPANGLYIRRQGNTVSKVTVK